MSERGRERRENGREKSKGVSLEVVQERRGEKTMAYRRLKKRREPEYEERGEGERARERVESASYLVYSILSLRSSSSRPSSPFVRDLSAFGSFLIDGFSDKGGESIPPTKEAKIKTRRVSSPVLPRFETREERFDEPRDPTLRKLKKPFFERCFRSQEERLVERR